MSKEKTVAASPFWRGLFQVGWYKASQGRFARQVTLAVLLVALVVGTFRLYHTLTGFWGQPDLNVAENGAKGFLAPVAGSLPFGVSLFVGLVGAWLAFRLVNLPTFADFLIAVEAEMNKVSWPTRSELFRSSIVVIVTILGLVLVLYVFDGFWFLLLQFLGVVSAGGGGG